MTADNFWLPLLANIIGIILGGGLIALVIEWRRHQRELKQWELQDRQLQIDIPKAEMAASMWTLTDRTDKDRKILIYENRLENTVSDLLVVAEFVIRNTTSAEIIVTGYDVKVLNIPSGKDEKRFYELDTLDLISKEAIGAVKLRPLTTLSNFVIIESEFGANRRLENVPTTLAVEATTSSGNTIQGVATLNVVKHGVGDLEYSPDGVLHPRRYAEKLKPPAPQEEDDIPF
jgi:hypothetical protein